MEKVDAEIRLQDQALVLLLLFGQKSCTGRMLEDLTDALVGLCRTLEILVSPDLLAHLLTLFGSNGLLACLVEFFDGLLVVAEILLAAHEDNGESLAEMQDLRDPLLLNVIEGVGRVDSEANEDNMGIWV